MNESGTLVEW